MNWFLFGIWVFIGLLNLCLPCEISKISYACMWFTLILKLLLEALEKVV